MENRCPPARGELRFVDVFVGGPSGGNPVPFVADASSMTPEGMQEVARMTGHESAFALKPTDGAANIRLRFFVPKHEMEMCGHATVGTLWALKQWGMWDGAPVRIETLSGLVDAEWDADGALAWISQPTVQRAELTDIERAAVAEVLGLPTGRLPAMTNSATSRVKTLVEMPDIASLNALTPRFEAMEALCISIGSTGLYPYAVAGQDDHGRLQVAARQFPRSSGYPEDAATGIAAAALWGHLAASGRVSMGESDTSSICTIRQGDAMGRPSAIQIRARFDESGRPAGCWLSGRVTWAAPA
ncbi:MAG: PhzF family phenazine biosynthesis protein [Pseudacidovorax sp.]|nr:PhzF family phenazine biosynthesis protein [Pseudacidovorax sp.]